jgi:hypothetical protein
MRPIKRLWNREQNQIFVWAGERPLQLKYSGFIFYVPPRHEVAKVGPGSMYRFESAKDGNGRAVPGTIVVKDILSRTPDGGYSKTFDVDACCRFLDRDRQRLFERGFQIVSEPGEIGVAMDDALPRYEAAEDARAHQILATEMERQKGFRDKGQDPPESSSAEQVAWAMKHLSRPGRKADRPEYGADQIKAVLSGTAPPSPEATAAPPVVETVPVDIPDDEVEKNIRLYHEAKEAGVKLTRTELAGLLENDTEMVELVIDKLKVKQEGAQAS